MRLTYQADYALRLLMFLALQRDERSSIREAAERYGVSENHLMKVTQRLAALGFVDALRGRGGGIKLARTPASISLGAVVRAMEPDFALVECMGEDNTCPISTACTLRGILDEARGAFLEVLDRYTLADVMERPRKLQALLGMQA
jgi:Rrf2 family nitric oxide-sensitive transcriptional repressor